MRELFEKLTDMQVLKLQEGDVLVLRIPSMSTEGLERFKKMISEDLKPKLPVGVGVIVFDNTIDIRVIRREG